MLVLATLVLAGCSDEVTFAKRPLDNTQTRNELQELGITLPDDYVLVSMTQMPPPGPGGASYDGIFTSPLPVEPVMVDAVSLTMTPTTCPQLQWSELPDGSDCTLMSDLRHGAVQLATMDILTVVSGRLPSSEGRIFLSVSGH